MPITGFEPRTSLSEATALPTEPHQCPLHCLEQSASRYSLSMHSLQLSPCVTASKDSTAERENLIFFLQKCEIVMTVSYLSERCNFELLLQETRTNYKRDVSFLLFLSDLSFKRLLQKRLLLQRLVP